MLVKATKKGYYLGPRAVGDEFDLPLRADGKEPTGSWFVKIEQPKAPVKAIPPQADGWKRGAKQADQSLAAEGLL